MKQKTNKKTGLNNPRLQQVVSEITGHKPGTVKQALNHNRPNEIIEKTAEGVRRGYEMGVNDVKEALNTIES